METSNALPQPVIGQLIDPIAFLAGSNPPPGDLSDYCFLRMCGDILVETSGIFDGDLLLVRRTTHPRPGELVLGLSGTDPAVVQRYGSEEWDRIYNGRGEISIHGVVCGIVRRF